MRWQSSARFRGLRPVATAPWATLLALGLPGWVLAVSATAAAVVPEHHASTAGQPPLDWLLTDRGPFHRAQEYTDFVERYRQGFTTRYRIYSGDSLKQLKTLLTGMRTGHGKLVEYILRVISDD